MSDNTVHWGPQGQPVSTRFNDVYFSNDNGLDESRYVFLQHNQLQERFSQLTSDGHFTLGETGFGTGLNFLACWQLWQQTAPEGARLTYLSVEKYPLSVEVMTKALSLWPELSPLTKPLLQQWAYIYTGQQRQTSYHFRFGTVRLIIIIDDAAQGLSRLAGSRHPDFIQPEWHGVDAWLLDGFAPAKNPDMWTDSLFTTLSQLSHRDTTFATFTAAGIVRRGLTQAGFSVNKVPGYGRKREMLQGHWQQPPQSDRQQPADTPWYQSRQYQPLSPSQSSKTEPVVIVGAGMAGCHTAYALANRGFQVVIVEHQNTIAAGASGNPQGVVYGKLSAQPQPLNDFNLASLLYALPLYQQFWQANPTQGSSCGVLQLSYNENLLQTHQQLSEQFSQEGLLRWLSAEEASLLSQQQLSCPALYFPNSGWINPPALCHWLLDHPNIRLMTNTQVKQLESIDSGWRLYGDSDDQPWQQVASAVVITTANQTKSLSLTQWLPLKPVRGQVSYLSTPNPWDRLSTVICAEGYIGPPVIVDGQPVSVIGASYNLHSDTQALSDQDHTDNIERITRHMPMKHVPTCSGGRVSFRCTTPDYLPIAGPAPDFSQFMNDFAELKKNARKPIDRAGEYHPRLYINVGHGSRGLIYTPLAADIIASHIAGEPPPIDQTLVNRLNPGRFLIRRLIRE